MNNSNKQDDEDEEEDSNSLNTKQRRTEEEEDARKAAAEFSQLLLSSSKSKSKQKTRKTRKKKGTQQPPTKNDTDFQPDHSSITFNKEMLESPSKRITRSSALLASDALSNDEIIPVKDTEHDTDLNELNNSIISIFHNADKKNKEKDNETEMKSDNDQEIKEIEVDRIETENINSAYQNTTDVTDTIPEVATDVNVDIAKSSGNDETENSNTVANPENSITASNQDDINDDKLFTSELDKQISSSPLKPNKQSESSQSISTTEEKSTVETSDNIALTAETNDSMEISDSVDATTGPAQIDNAENEDNQEDGVQDVGCPLCKQIRQDNADVKKQSQTNFQFFKKKLISTSELITEYHKKSQELSDERNKVKELEKKLEKIYGETGSLRIQLEKALQANDPLKKNIRRLEYDKMLRVEELGELKKKEAVNDAEVNRLNDIINSSREIQDSYKKNKDEVEKMHDKEKKKVLTQAKVMDKLTDRLKRSREQNKTQVKALRQAVKENKNLMKTITQLEKKITKKPGNKKNLKKSNSGKASRTSPSGILSPSPSPPASPQVPVKKVKKRGRPKKTESENPPVVSAPKKASSSSASASSHSSSSSSSSSSDSSSDNDQEGLGNLHNLLAKSLEQQLISPKRWMLPRYMSPTLSPLPPSPVPHAYNNNNILESNRYQPLPAMEPLQQEEGAIDLIDNKTSEKSNEESSVEQEVASVLEQIVKDIDPASFENTTYLNLENNLLNDSTLKKDLLLSDGDSSDSSSSKEASPDLTQDTTKATQDTGKQTQDTTKMHDTTKTHDTTITQDTSKTQDKTKVIQGARELTDNIDADIPSFANHEPLQCYIELTDINKTNSGNVSNERKKPPEIILTQKKKRRRRRSDEKLFSVIDKDSAFKRVKKTRKLSYSSSDDNDDETPQQKRSKSPFISPQTNAYLSTQSTVENDIQNEDVQPNDRADQKQHETVEPKQKPENRLSNETVIDEQVQNNTEDVSSVLFDACSSESAPTESNDTKLSSEHTSTPNLQTESMNEDIPIVSPSEQLTVPRISSGRSSENSNKSESPILITAPSLPNVSIHPSPDKDISFETMLPIEVEKRNSPSVHPDSMAVPISVGETPTASKCVDTSSNFTEQNISMDSVKSVSEPLPTTVDDIDETVSQMKEQKSAKRVIQTALSPTKSDALDDEVASLKLSSNTDGAVPGPSGLQTNTSSASHTPKVNRAAESDSSDEEVVPKPVCQLLWSSRKPVTRRHSTYVSSAINPVEHSPARLRIDRTRSLSPSMFKPLSPPLSPIPPSPRRTILTPIISPLPTTPLPESVSPLPPSPKITSPPLIRGTAVLYSENSALHAPKPVSRITVAKDLSFTSSPSNNTSKADGTVQNNMGRKQQNHLTESDNIVQDSSLSSYPSSSKKRVSRLKKGPTVNFDHPKDGQNRQCSPAFNKAQSNQNTRPISPYLRKSKLKPKPDLAVVKETPQVTFKTPKQPQAQTTSSAIPPTCTENQIISTSTITNTSTDQQKISTQKLANSTSSSTTQTTRSRRIPVYSTPNSTPIVNSSSSQMQPLPQSDESPLYKDTRSQVVLTNNSINVSAKKKTVTVAKEVSKKVKKIALPFCTVHSSSDDEDLLKIVSSDNSQSDTGIKKETLKNKPNKIKKPNIQTDTLNIGIFNKVENPNIQKHSDGNFINTSTKQNVLKRKRIDGNLSNLTDTPDQPIDEIENKKLKLNPSNSNDLVDSHLEQNLANSSNQNETISKRKSTQDKKQHTQPLSNIDMRQKYQNEYGFTIRILNRLHDGEKSLEETIRILSVRTNLCTALQFAKAIAQLVRKCQETLMPKILKSLESEKTNETQCLESTDSCDDSNFEKPDFNDNMFCHHCRKNRSVKEMNLDETLKSNAFFLCHPLAKKLQIPCITRFENKLLVVMQQVGLDNTPKLLLLQLEKMLFKEKDLLSCERMALCRFYAVVCRVYNWLDKLVAFLYSHAYDQLPHISFPMLFITCYFVWPSIVLRTDLLLLDRNDESMELKLFKIKMSPLSAVLQLVALCDAVERNENIYQKNTFSLMEQKFGESMMDIIAYCGVLFKHVDVRIQILQALFDCSCSKDVVKKFYESVMHELFSLLCIEELSVVTYTEDGGFVFNSFVFSVCKSIELLCTRLGWQWCYDEIILSKVWPLLLEWTNGLKKSDLAVILIRLIGRLCRTAICLGHRDFSTLIKFFEKTLPVLSQDSLVPISVEVAVVYTLLDMLPSDESQGYHHIIHKWVEQMQQRQKTIPMELRQAVANVGCLLPKKK